MRHCGCVSESRRRVTISVPVELAAQVEALVKARGTTSVSAYFAEAAADRLAREESLRRLREFTGGPPSPELRRRAEKALGIVPNEASTTDRKVS
jgi:hypothetical protein